MKLDLQARLSRVSIKRQFHHKISRLPAANQYLDIVLGNASEFYGKDTYMYWLISRYTHLKVLLSAYFLNFIYLIYILTFQLQGFVLPGGGSVIIGYGTADGGRILF